MVGFRGYRAWDFRSILCTSGANIGNMKPSEGCSKLLEGILAFTMSRFASYLLRDCASSQLTWLTKSLESGKRVWEFLKIRFRFSTAPLSNSWIILIVWLYIAFNRTPNIDCYKGGAVPKV